LLKSTDGGSTFAPLTVVSDNGAQATATAMLALAPGYREAGPTRTLFAAVLQAYVPTTADKNNAGRTAGGIYRSDDGGATWKSLGANGPVFHGASAVAVAPDGRVFAGWTDGSGHAGIACSVNGSAYWAQRCPARGTSGGSTSGSTQQGAAQSTATPCTTACGSAGGNSGKPPGQSGGPTGGNAEATETPLSAHAQGGTSGPPRLGLILGGVAIAAGFFAFAIRVAGARRAGRASPGPTE
jgi:hypothetical protein